MRLSRLRCEHKFYGERGFSGRNFRSTLDTNLGLEQSIATLKNGKFLSPLKFSHRYTFFFLLLFAVVWLQWEKISPKSQRAFQAQQKKMQRGKIENAQNYFMGLSRSRWCHRIDFVSSRNASHDLFFFRWLDVAMHVIHMQETKTIFEIPDTFTCTKIVFY